MTRKTIDHAIRAFKSEVRDSVSSYFAPVRAVVREVSRSVDASTKHGRKVRQFTTDAAPKSDGDKRR